MDKFSNLIAFWQVFDNFTEQQLQQGLSYVFEEIMKEYGPAKFRELIFKILLSKYKEDKMIKVMHNSKKRILIEGNKSKKTKISQKWNKGHNTRTITDLPSVILQKTFSYLEGKYLNIQQSVSRYFLCEARKPSSFHNSYLTLNIPCYPNELHSLLYDIKKEKKYYLLKKLTIKIPNNDNSNLIEKYFREFDAFYTGISFAEVFSRLETLKIKYSGVDRILIHENVLGQFERLRNLFLGKFVSVTDSFWRLHNQANMTFVPQSFMCEKEILRPDSLRNLNVKVLNVHETPYNRDEQLVMNNLKALRIRCLNPTKEALSIYLFNAPKLDYLSIVHPRRFAGFTFVHPRKSAINISNVKEFDLDMEHYICNYNASILNFFGWKRDKKPKMVVLKLQSGRSNLFYRRNKIFLSELDSLKLTISFSSNLLPVTIFCEFLEFIQLWDNKHIKPPKHILLRFIVAHSISREKVVKGVEEYRKVLNYLSNYGKKMGIETFLTIYDVSPFKMSPFKPKNVNLERTNERMMNEFDNEQRFMYRRSDGMTMVRYDSDDDFNGFNPYFGNIPTIDEILSTHNNGLIEVPKLITSHPSHIKLHVTQREAQISYNDCTWSSSYNQFTNKLFRTKEEAEHFLHSLFFGQSGTELYKIKTKINYLESINDVSYVFE